jgi:DNA sulfur modification protein DndD
MRIERLILRNYRQFRQAQLKFGARADTDLHFLIGTNATGKTNLLNAINWCLYGDEPHLSKDSQQLPLLNLLTLDRAEPGQIHEVSVEVWTETEDGALLTFARRAPFVKDDEGQVTRQGMTLTVNYVDAEGNTQTCSDDAAELWIERFVPARIREFFFFDGERLDSYFRLATAQNIRHAVFDISQIELLESRVQKRLETTLDDFAAEAGRANPKIEKARSSQEQARAQLDETNQRIEECERQIEIARTRLAELAELLKGVPDTLGLEEERKQLDERLRDTKKLLKEKMDERETLLVESGSLLMLWPAISGAQRLIAKKRSLQELPPPVDKTLLDEVLRAATCSVCGRPLDDESDRHVRGLLQEVELASQSMHRLQEIEIPLYGFREEVERFRGRAEAIASEIEQHERTLEAFAARKTQIDRELAGYDKDLISGWYTERTTFEQTRDQNQQRLGALLLMRAEAEKAFSEAQEQLSKELKKEEKVRELRRKVGFCTRAVEVVRATREAIVRETRQRIEAETKRHFFRLVWRKATYSDVRIGDDYGIRLFHSMGYECLGSLSAGERELLALAFTLALHHTSGFDSPILIDTPVARISDEQRAKFAQVLCEVSTGKQIVLLFTPAEYSEDVSRHLSGRASSRFELRPLAGELETKVEVL